MDITSILGPIVALGMIILGMILKHATELIPQMFNGSAICIVLGGTFGALMVAYPLNDYINSLKAIVKWLKPPQANLPELQQEIIDLAQTARKESILALEKRTESISFHPLKMAVKLAVDGTDPAIIRETLEMELMIEHEESEVSVKFWEDFGAISPTIGILGAVIGLMKVMTVLDQPEKIGPGIAVAFIATIWGVGVANLFGLPVAKKIKRKIILEGYAREMVIVGIDGILNGLNPKLIDEKLRIFTGEVPGEAEAKK
jgi:chemotaxis protein MotA